jgi:NitT/TauT family transport system substrate-binding protein
MSIIQTRRRFISTLASTGLAGLTPTLRALAAEGPIEPPPETTTVRLARDPTICFAPLYVCEDLLRVEGFTDIGYVDIEIGLLAGSEEVGHGRVDFASLLTLNHIVAIDASAPITIVTGVHAGCYELFAHDGIRAITDLKGKSVGAPGAQALISLMAAWVGLDPKKDLKIVSDPEAKPLELFAEGKLDAFLAFPPQPQELHARKIGNVILRTAVDRPWSQYFCCTLAGNREFVARHPAATKRVIRALLKAADLCVSAPEQAARLLIRSSIGQRYDYALQTLNENPYGNWREYDGEDTVRFYALRAHELGMIKRDPKRILADGSNFRFFEELKRELRA